MGEKWWINYPWRLIQTNLREIDMADIDAYEYVRQLMEFNATVVMINTAGIIASYDTDHDFHFQSQYLTGDSLETIITACHEAGIKVIARTDFSKIRLAIYEKHPEWAFRTADGEIINYNGDVHVCINSDYQQKYSLQIMEEVIHKLDVDGMYFNMSGFVQRDYSYKYYGICHCSSCKKRFHEMYGFDLPRTSDLTDLVYRAYRLFQKQVATEQNEKIYNYLNSLKSGLCISKAPREGFYREESNTAIGRALPCWQYDASENTKWIRSSYGQNMVSSNSSVDFIDFPARHTAVSPGQQRLRLYQNLAHGGGLDYYLIGRLDNHRDRSGYEAVKEVFDFHRTHSDIYDYLVSNAKIALVRDNDSNKIEYRGWYRFLAENHFLFDTPIKESITDEILSRYQTIILPDCKYVSDGFGQMIDRFVENGGNLISVFESGMGNEKFEVRPNLAFASLGIENVRIIRHNMRGSYFEIERYLFPHLSETELLYLDGGYVYADYKPDSSGICRLIPPQMFGPPERCYSTCSTDYPGIVKRKFGKGRAMFIPWQPGRFYYEQGYVAYLAFARDTLEKIMGVEPILTDLPEMVEITSMSNTDRSYELISMVNNSGHFGISFFNPISLNKKTLSIPCTHEVSRITSLATGQNIDFSISEGKMVIQVPYLEMFDALHIIY